MTLPAPRRRRGLGVVVGLLAAVASPAAPASVAGPVSRAPAPCHVKATLLRWPLATLAAETVVVPADSDDLAAAAPALEAGAGGLILFGSRAPLGFRTELAALERVRLAPFVMTDEEGGAAQRLENVLGQLPSARTMGATLAPAAITALARHVGAALRGVGVSMDLAPVLDVDGGAGPNDADADGTRSFSAVPSRAAADGLAFARGLQAGGVVPVVKHFPGLGGASGNTDVRPASTLPLGELEHGGLVPFEAAVAAGLPAVMVADASVPGLSPLPADLSPAVVTGLLRDRLGFRGLVLTDSLSAPSISGAGYTVPEAAVAALRAGADMVLYDPGAASFAAIVASVSAAVTAGHLSRVRLVDAVADVLAAKGLDVCTLRPAAPGALPA